MYKSRSPFLSGGGPTTSSPAWGVDVNTYVNVGSPDGHLYAFDGYSGVLEWTGATGGPIHSSPTVANFVVYVGSDDGKLYAFPQACVAGPPPSLSCTPIWTASTGGAIASSPAVANGVVYVGSADHHLYAFSASGCGSTSCSPLFTSPSTKPPS